MARGHNESRAAAPRIERATPHMTQPNASRGGGGPPMNARAQMPAPAAPRAAAPAMPQGGGAPHKHQRRTARWRRTGRWRRPRSGQAPMNEKPGLEPGFFLLDELIRLAVSLYKRRRRQDAAALLDRSLSKLFAQIAMHDRARAADYAMGSRSICSRLCSD